MGSIGIFNSVAPEIHHHRASGFATRVHGKRLEFLEIIFAVKNYEFLEFSLWPFPLFQYLENENEKGWF